MTAQHLTGQVLHASTTPMCIVPTPDVVPLFGASEETYACPLAPCASLACASLAPRAGLDCAHF